MVPIKPKFTKIVENRSDDLIVPNPTPKSCENTEREEKKVMAVSSDEYL
jgi:hypothetical protein